MFRLACLLFFFFCAQAWAAPLYARQNASPTTVMTVHQTTTPSGPMIETCVITLTPIKNAQGEDAVEQVKRCKLTPAGTNNGSAGGGAAATSSFSTIETVPPSATNTLSTVSVTPSAGGEGGNGAISVIGLTTGSAAPTSAPGSSSGSAASSASTSASSSRSASSAAVTGSAGGAVANGPASSVATSAVPIPPTGISVGGNSGAISTASVSAAAAEASNSATEAFSTPGKKLSVLPIGLGVFAGISVIALIVVGLVTYERTKYRKAFRQRKLAETGQAMGYGGMAPRP